MDLEQNSIEKYMKLYQLTSGEFHFTKGTHWLTEDWMLIKKSFDISVPNQPCLLSTYISAPEPASKQSYTVTGIQKDLGIVRPNFRNLHS